MNHIYKVIWNTITQTWVAVSELSRAKGKTKSKKILSAAAVMAVSAVGVSTNVEAAVDYVTGTTFGNGMAIGSSSNANTNATAYGHGANARALEDVAIGYKTISGASVSSSTSHSSAQASVAVGTYANATHVATTAIGAHANAINNFATAVGAGALANKENGSAFGQGAMATGVYATALGKGALAKQDYSVALGKEAAANTQLTTSIGSKTNATGFSAIAIGSGHVPPGNSTIENIQGAQATADDAMAVGASALANETGATALGKLSKATNNNAVAVGPDSVASGSWATATGASSKASGQASAAFGESARATGKTSIATGSHASASAENAIAIGNKTKAQANNTIAIGAGANATANATGSLVIGSGAVVNAKDATVVGPVAQANGANATAVGRGAAANGTESTALGRGATATGNQTVALGQGAQAKVDSGVALGDGAVADRTARSQNGIVINTSDPSKSKGFNTENSVYAPVRLVDDPNALKLIKNTINGNKGAVSVGDSGNTRQIINVAAGSADSDAVNVAQLKAVAGAIKHYDVTSKNGDITVTHPNPQDPNKTVWNLNLNPDRVKEITKWKLRDVEENGNPKAGQTDALVKGDETVTFQDTDTINVERDGKTLKFHTKKNIKYFSVKSSDGGNQNNDGATATDAIAIGKDASSTGSNAVSLGLGAKALGANNTAIGPGAQAKDVRTTAVGYNATAEAASAVGIGYEAHATKSRSLAIGQDATASANNAIALGSSGQHSENKTTASAEHAVAIGSGAVANIANGIALGSQSKTTQDKGQSGFDASQDVEGARTNNYKNLKNNIQNVRTSTLAGLSIGDTGKTRQINHLAAGTADDDAVNVAQLKSVNLAFKGDNNTKGDVRLDDQRLSVVGDKNSFITTTASSGELKINTTQSNELQFTAGAANNITTPTGLTTDKAVANAINNSGWKISQGTTQKDIVNPGDTVNFTNGTGTTATVTNKDGKTTTVKYDVATGKGLEVADNKVTVKTDGDTITVDNDGKLKASLSTEKVKAADKVGDDDNIATVTPSTTDASKYGSKGATYEVAVTKSAVKQVAKTAVKVAAGDNVIVSSKDDATNNETTYTVEAVTPVVYTDKQGNRVYKVKDGNGYKFTKNADGTGEVVDKSEVIASFYDGNNSTTAGTMIVNNVGSAIKNVTVPAGKDATNFLNKLEVAASATGTPNAAVNVSDLHNTAEALRSNEIHIAPTKDAEGQNPATHYTYNATTKQVEMTYEDGKGNKVANKKAVIDLSSLADSVHNYGFKANATGHLETGSTATETEVENGKTVNFDAGKNLTVKQTVDAVSKNHTYSFALSNNVELTNAGSITVGGTKVDNGGITIDATTPAAGETKKPDVTLTNTGLSNGDNHITNVKGNLPDTYNTAEGDKTITKKQDAPTSINNTNAATVGDVLNAGWNLQGNGKEIDFVKPYDTVNFTNGTGTTATVTNKDGKTTTVKYDVATGKGLEVADNKVTVKTDGDTITVDNDGKLKASLSTEKVKAADKVGDDDNIATVTPSTTDASKYGSKGATYEVAVTKSAVKQVAKTAVKVAAGDNVIVSSKDDATNNETTYTVEAVTPVVYTDKQGNRVYKVKDGNGYKFTKNADGTGEVVDKSEVIASFYDGNNSTTAGTMIVNNVGSAIKNVTVPAGKDATNFLNKLEVAASATGTPNAAVNVSDLHNTAEALRSNEIHIAPTKDAEGQNPATHYTYNATTKQVEMTYEDGKGNKVANKKAVIDLSSLADSVHNYGFKANATGHLETGSTATETEVENGKTVNFDAGKNLTVKQTVDAVSKNHTYSFALKDDVVIGAKGENGKDGIDGSIGVNGKDGSAVAINGKDGSIGLNGKDGKNGLTIKGDKGAVGVDGTNGKDGKDGMTRIVYTDNNQVKHEVATLDDGQKYAGDNYVAAKDNQAESNVIAKKANERLDIVGGAKGNLTEDNIGVNAKDGKLHVQLAEKVNLGDKGSVTIGDTVVNNNGITINSPADLNGVTNKTVSLTNQGLNNGGNKITNVAEGENDTDAVNVKQLKTFKDEVGGYGWNLSVNNGKDASKITKDTTVDLNNDDGNIKIAKNGSNVTLSLGPDVGLGKAGKDGKDGSLAVRGKDGASVEISGKDGSIGLTGPKGKDGTPGASATITVEKGTTTVNDGRDGDNKVNRIVYTDKDKNGKDIKREVATLDDGLKFKGDSKEVINRTLGSQMNITGGADENKLTDKNIGVVYDKATNGLKVKLSKDVNLGNNGTITIGDTVVNKDGLTINGGPSVTKGGVNAGNQSVTNVKDGTADNDAVNVKQLKTAKTEVEAGDHIDVTSRVGANGQTIYKVSAKGINDTSAAVKGGSNHVEVTKAANTHKDGSTTVTDYTVDLSKETKEDIKKGVDAHTEVTTKGLTFNADHGTTGVKKLGSKVAVNGDGKNITTTADENGVKVSMKDDIKVNSVTAKEVKVGDVNINENGINAGGKRITNVAPGKDGTDAVNVNQLKYVAGNISNQINNVDKGLRAGIAGALASGGLYHVTTAGKSMVSVGAGTYRGQNALAVGYSRLSDNGKVGVKFTVNSNSQGHSGASASVGYQW